MTQHPAPAPDMLPPVPARRALEPSHRDDRTIPTNRLLALHSWSSVGRWALWGTLACVAISVAFSAVVFADLGAEVLRRAIISAIILPGVLGGSLFLYMGARIRGLAIANLRLGLVARTDSLTACLNRGAFTSKVSTLLGQRSSSTGALLIIDADNFKSINDLFGHYCGDEALTIIARSIRTILRAGDLVGRMGGEEFGVYLPDVTQESAGAVAERIRRSVNLAIFAPQGQQRPLSVSIGGVAFTGPARFSELFHIADQRLYGAKQAGRNRVAIAHMDDHPEIGRRQSA